MEFEVYPRVCGGTVSVVRSKLATKGLSPRVRGNLPTLTAVFNLPRSIPACAGNLHKALRAMQGCRSIPACAGEPWSGSPVRRP